MKDKRSNKIAFIFSTIAIFLINVEIPFLTSFSGASLIYKSMQIACLLILLAILIKNKLNVREFLFLLAFYAIYILTTVIHGGSVIIIIANAIKALNLISFFSLSKRRSATVLIVSSSILGILLAINLFVIINFNSGIYYGGNPNPYYLLGHRNDTIEYILPALLMLNIYSAKTKRGVILKAFLIAVSFSNVLLTWSANAIFVAIVISLIIGLFIPILINIRYYPFILSNLIALMLSNIFLQFLRGLGKNKEYSIASIIDGVSTLVVNLILILGFNCGAESILISSTVANIFCLIFVVVDRKRIGSYFDPDISWRRVQWYIHCIMQILKYTKQHFFDF